MNPNSGEPQKIQLEPVSSRIQHLEKWVDEVRRQNASKRRNYYIFGIALVALSSVSLSIMTSTLFRLDTQAVAELGRQEVERQLPGGVTSLTDYLKGQAPQVVSEMLRSALQMIPQLRVALVRDLEEHTSAIKKEYEKKLIAAMQEALRSAKESIDKQAPNKSDVEKLELLVAQISGDFQNLSHAAIQELKPHYASEMNRVQSFLADLHHKNDSEMSHREKVQKELIQTLLQLMVREERKGL